MPPRRPTVWAVKGAHILPDDHIRHPDGTTRRMDEEALLTSDDPPLYTDHGRYRIINTGPERLLVPTLRQQDDDETDISIATEGPVPPPTTEPPTTDTPTTPPPTTPPPTTPPPTTPPPTTPPPTTPPP